MLFKEEFHLKQNVEPFIHYREKHTTFECITRENIEAVAAKVRRRRRLSATPVLKGQIQGGFSILRVEIAFIWGSTSFGESSFCLVGQKNQDLALEDWSSPSPPFIPSRY